jgi:hypothetical protein
LLFGEYLNERLLLRLPHRQMVFTFPKVLHQYGEIARFHPHLHAIVLEGGFDGKGRFVRIPAGSPRTRKALSQYIARPPVSLQKLAAAVPARLPGSLDPPLWVVLFPIARYLAAQAPPGASGP